MKKTREKSQKFIVSLLCFGFLITGIPIKIVVAENKDDFSGELVEKREMYSKHFQKEDGSMRAATYNYPIHYQDERGNWQDIDNTMIDSVDYQPYSLLKSTENEFEKFYTSKDNPLIHAYFNKTTSTSDLIRVNFDDYSVIWGLEDLLDSDAIVLNKQKSEDPYNLTNITNGVKYEEAFLNADLYYYITSGTLKEEIVLNEKSNFDTLVYNVKTDLIPFKTEHNLVIFQNENQENIFSFQNPYMYDSAEKSGITFDTTVDIEPMDNGYKLIYHLDSEWLNSNERVYPIVIDPTASNDRNPVNIHDTYVHPGDTVSHNHVNEDRLWVGNVNGTSRAFINWANLPNINGDIYASWFLFNYFKGTSSWGALELYQVDAPWDSTKLTWNVHNTLGRTLLLSDLYPSYVDGYQNFILNVTDTVQGWYDGTVGKNGFMLKYQNESYNDYNTILSSDSGGIYDYWPSLYIDYLPYNTAPYKAYTPSYYSDYFSSIAITASNSLNNLGYQTTFMRNPSADQINANLPSRIAIFAGHGDSGHLFLGDRVITTGSGNGNLYNTVTPEHTQPKTRWGMGIKQWDLSKVDLLVFAGCATAFWNGAITPIAAQAADGGARVSIGWDSKPQTLDMQRFLEVFISYLGSGLSVKDAVNRAKAYYPDYINSAIYEARIFGYDSLKLHFPNGKYKFATLNDEDDNFKEHDISSLIYNDTDLQDNVADFIKNEINNIFDINDYVIEKGSDIIRFIYAPSHVRTQNAYTAILKDNKVEKLFSYISEEFDSVDTRIRNSKKLAVDEEQKIKHDIINKSDGTKKYIIYDEGYWLKNGKFEYYVLYYIENESFTQAEYVSQVIE